MSDKVKDESDDTPLSKKPIRLALSSPKGVRRSLSRLARLRLDQRISTAEARDLCSILTVALSYDRFIVERALLDRVEALEKAVGDQGAARD